MAINRSSENLCFLLHVSCLLDTECGIMLSFYRHLELSEVSSGLIEVKVCSASSTKDPLVRSTSKNYALCPTVVNHESANCLYCREKVSSCFFNPYSLQQWKRGWVTVLGVICPCLNNGRIHSILFNPVFLSENSTENPLRQSEDNQWPPIFPQL